MSDEPLQQGLEAPPASSPAALRSGWEPLRAWRLHRVYRPLASAVRSVTAVALAERARDQRRDKDARTPLRVLEIGGQAGVLSALLARDSILGEGLGLPDYEVVSVAALGDARTAARDGAFDCVVAMDWLPLVSPSQREQALAELCREAREGIVLANPFRGPEVVAAMRAVNDLHRAVRGCDHPTLGRQLELGLPDAETVGRWVTPFFPSVSTRSYEHIALWRAAESLAIMDDRGGEAPSPVDAVAAGIYEMVGPLEGAEPGYQTLLVALSRPARFDDPAPPSISSARPELTALAMHQALELAAQRRVLERLVEAVEVRGQRERDDFKATLASLAEQLQELDARAEFLAREVRARDHALSNQQALLAETEAGLLARLESAEAQARSLDEAHQRFLQSRAGRALRAYEGLKALFRGRG